MEVDLGTRIYDGFMSYFENNGLHELRTAVLGEVSGDVLELGPGTGANLKYCNPEKIRSMTYVDLKFSPALEERARAKCPDIRLVTGDAQSLPFEDGSFDSVVFTLVFCSVEDPMQGLSEIMRVLKDDGRIFFIEHIEPKEGLLKPVFNVVNPVWRKVAGGCNLNRSTWSTLEEAGFELTRVGEAFGRVFVAGTGRKRG